MKWLVLVLAWPAMGLADDPQATAPVEYGSPETLRAAICDLMADFGPRYPSGDALLRQLDLIEKQMSADADGNRAAFRRLQREALIANPLVSGALSRAFEAMSASSNSLRLACAQHPASVIGPGFRPGS